jgi:ligand-binding SRPBCC domain-containing protein
MAEKIFWPFPTPNNIKMAFYQFSNSIFLRASLDEVWAFISSPENLKKITPPSMGFEITSGKIPEKMYPGLIISYTVRPFARIPMTWVTEITHVEERKYFVDEQRLGPYAFWHHQHWIEPSGDGVKMTDIVSYSPPFGFLGRIANGLIIKPQLDTIFGFREKALLHHFGPNTRLA